MNYYSFPDELDNLLQLVKFKQFVRHGNVLFSEHLGVYRPEYTVEEIVWGWCKNPCFANRLIAELNRLVPDFTKVLGNANRNISKDNVTDDFDQAIKLLCDKSYQPQHVVAYHVGSTNPNDCVYGSIHGGEYVRFCNATDNDGELWHGLMVNSLSWANGVDRIKMFIYGRTEDEPNILWQETFSSKSIIKKTVERDGVVVFQPFKHPFPLMDLDVKIVVQIFYTEGATDTDAFSLFGLGSDSFCAWLQQAKFEIRLCKGVSARIDMHNSKIVFK